MIKQRLTQTQTQRLVMTPQLQQAVKLLQLSSLELEQLIEQEMETNPALDIEDSPFSETQSTTPELQASTPSASDNKESETVEAAETRAIEETNWEDLIPDDRNWESMDIHETGFEERNGYLSNVQSTVEDLNEHLLEQAHWEKLTPEEMTIAEEIIGNIDHDGYLRISLEELAQQINVPMDACQKVLAIIHTFEPKGVGARDLRECLMIQCVQGKIDNPIVLALLEPDNFHDFVGHHFPQIAKRTGYKAEKIIKAAQFLATLNPKPGQQYSSTLPQYITPDVTVKKTDGDYEIILNDDRLPQLKISPMYMELLRKKATISSEEYSFVIDKFRAARALIRNVERRKRTILRVTEEIVNTQREFLDKGLDYLRPLKLREIADKLGLHESTVARVTSNKYIYTPQGTFELKYFFSHGLSNDDGESTSVRSVKLLVKQLISDENPLKPLSDQIIVEILKNKNINIARRTVAKYREQLKILPAHMRKQR